MDSSSVGSSVFGEMVSAVSSDVVPSSLVISEFPLSSRDSLFNVFSLSVISSARTVEGANRKNKARSTIIEDCNSKVEKPYLFMKLLFICLIRFKFHLLPSRNLPIYIYYVIRYRH